MTEIHAACFQWAVIPGRPDVNLSKVQKGIAGLAAKGAHLVVLPEMWSCGFDYGRLREIALETPGILTELASWCRRHRVVVVGSLPELDGGSLYNTNYVVDADGSLRGAYRKTHLFTLHGEHHHFAPGEDVLVCNTLAGRLGVITCYDLRFPELARVLALEGARILCVSAQWPLPRIEQWSLILRCRAVENQMFVVGCNGCGEEGDRRYGGASAIVSPLGVQLALANGEECTLFAKLDLQEVEAFREHIPCFRDRRPELYRLCGGPS